MKLLKKKKVIEKVPGTFSMRWFILNYIRFYEYNDRGCRIQFVR